MLPIAASSHREAPLISQDPLADNTDVYAFVSPERPDRVVLIANFIPLEFPSSGPNYWKFDDNVLYEIMIDNTGDAVEDLTYQFRFNTVVGNPNTFLYNTVQLRSLNGKTGAPVDGLGNYNVHTIALEIPISRLSRTGGAPAGASDPNASIGVWSTASRPATTTRTPGNAVSSGAFVQVSRLGMPLVNEVVIPLG